MHFVSSFQYLILNSDKKCFEILDSTDRKIISFLFHSVMPSCYFYHEQYLSTYPWSEKGFIYFKPIFLKKIDREFQKHIAGCPIEEYRQPLISFYNDLRQRICDFNIDSTVLKESDLLLLQRITTDCFKSLFSKPPLNMQHVHFRDLPEKNEEYLNALNNGQCYHFAFYLTEEYQTMMSMIPFKSPCNGAFLLYPRYFLQKLGYSETTIPVRGDLVLYLGDPKLHNNKRFKHLGMLTERGTVKSSWGNFACQFEHQIFQVPDMYGSEVMFFHKTHQPQNFDKILQTSNQMSHLILQFNSQAIPSPLTTRGTLLFLLDKLKSACKKSNQASKQWHWDKIEEDLFAAFSTKPSLNSTEVCKEFQLWVQEILPQYFINLP
jgi:hypothetical protein